MRQVDDIITPFLRHYFQAKHARASAVDVKKLLATSENFFISFWRELSYLKVILFQSFNH